VLYSP